VLLVLLGRHTKVTGDFSFTYSIVKNDLTGKVISTSLDDRQTLIEKYPSTVEEYLEYLESDPRVDVHYGVDGTKLEKFKPLKKMMGSLDMCIFNFPHVGNSVADQDRNILQHQKLLVGFFGSAKQMISSNGKILVALFEGEPYNSWNIKQLARSCGLQLERSGSFSWQAFPEYHHRLTAKEGSTSTPQRNRSARMYMFRKQDDTSDAKSNKRKRDVDSDSE
jgi:25S rRNA (uracil2634-N3)-methyltransferase